MAERLTERHGKYINVQPKEEIMCSNYCTSCGKADCDHIRTALEKLAHYEDLEEQGRLIVLPKGMTLRKLLEILDGNISSCPIDYNLTTNCELSCFECWLAALKGQRNNGEI